MSSRDHSNVDGYWLIAADALNFTFLQHSQQRDLDLGRHVAHFVQKHCPAIRRFKTSEATLGCAGEGGTMFQDEVRSEEHTSELQSHLNLVCRLLLEKKKINTQESKKHIDKD